LTGENRWVRDPKGRRLAKYRNAWQAGGVRIIRFQEGQEKGLEGGHRTVVGQKNSRHKGSFFCKGGLNGQQKNLLLVYMRRIRKRGTLGKSELAGQEEGKLVQEK